MGHQEDPWSADMLHACRCSVGGASLAGKTSGKVYSPGYSYMGPLTTLTERHCVCVCVCVAENGSTHHAALGSGQHRDIWQSRLREVSRLTVVATPATHRQIDQRPDSPSPTPLSPAPTIHCSQTVLFRV